MCRRQSPRESWYGGESLGDARGNEDDEDVVNETSETRQELYGGRQGVTENLDR